MKKVQIITMTITFWLESSSSRMSQESGFKGRYSVLWRIHSVRLPISCNQNVRFLLIQQFGYSLFICSFGSSIYSCNNYLFIINSKDKVWAVNNSSHQSCFYEKKIHNSAPSAGRGLRLLGRKQGVCLCSASQCHCAVLPSVMEQWKNGQMPRK